VGATSGTLEMARQRLLQDFPGINISASFPGFSDGPDNAREFIVQCGAEYVLVAMGMGQQERFLLDLREDGWEGSGICVGAFFDRLANPGHDYPAWSVRLNLRFLGNITRRPVYYLRRYCVEYLPFLKQYVIHLLLRKGSRG
jgi:N-acetylglucosaminyldiphosphoundecaprenol N-acetyl-beta-D-mannosaminyltransferase